MTGISKKIITIILSLVIILSFGSTVFAAEETEPEGKDYTQLFLDANDATLHLAAYDQSNFFPFWFSWFNLVQFYTYDEIMEAAKNPDETMLPLFESLEANYATINKITEYEDMDIDIWEGHDVLPVPGGVEEDTTSSINAALHDDDGFRPFMNFFPAEDPAAATGTILAVPSIRGGQAELTDVKAVFNGMNYNVFLLEPRMDTVEGLRYIDLQLDAQRAIRYIKYYAEDFGIDPEKLIVIGGSKGNLAHIMAYEYFDMTPSEVAEAVGKPLVDYSDDEIDSVLSNIQVSIVNYGNSLLCKDGEDASETITGSRIYSQENFENGLKFPALYVVTGNMDETGMIADMGSLISGLNKYNTSSDKLYPVGYEIHIMDQEPHGRGMGLDLPNVGMIWQEADVFIRMNLQ